MCHSFISCIHGNKKTSKNFAIWFWDIYSLLACLPSWAEEIPPLLVDTRLCWFCSPVISSLSYVPLFNVNIPISLKAQSWVGPCCAKCFTDMCLKQLGKRGKETVVQKSVLGLQTRPIFWTNTVCMGGCWMPLCPSQCSSHKHRLSHPTL